MPLPEELFKEPLPEELFTSKAVERFARQLLLKMDIPSYTVNKWAIDAKEPELFPESGTIKVEFSLGERSGNGDYREFSVDWPELGRAIIDTLKEKGFDIEDDGTNYIVNVSESRFAELAGAEGGSTRRADIKETLRQS